MLSSEGNKTDRPHVGLSRVSYHSLKNILTTAYATLHNQSPHTYPGSKAATLSWESSGQLVAKTMKVFQGYLEVSIPLKMSHPLAVEDSEAKDVLWPHRTTKKHVDWWFQNQYHLPHLLYDPRIKLPPEIPWMLHRHPMKPNISSASIPIHHSHLPLPVSLISMSDTTVYLIA